MNAGAVRVAIALGSNAVDRGEMLQGGLAAIAQIEGVWLLVASCVEDTEPFGPPQPRYLNQMVLVETTLPPLVLLNTLQSIELQHGRERSVPKGPRTLDLDIVYRRTRENITRLVASRPGQALGIRPAAVAVHDDRHMIGVTALLAMGRLGTGTATCAQLCLACGPGSCPALILSARPFGPVNACPVRADQTCMISACLASSARSTAAIDLSVISCTSSDHIFWSSSDMPAALDFLIWSIPSRRTLRIATLALSA
jgi:2-amino-4-hydroxy-6-hydroxymethyldihydropteridine diphosphokinase